MYGLSVTVSMWVCVSECARECACQSMSIYVCRYKHVPALVYVYSFECRYVNIRAGETQTFTVSKLFNHIKHYSQCHIC